jgi:hypothetical protein
LCETSPSPITSYTGMKDLSGTRTNFWRCKQKKNGHILLQSI